MLRMNCPKCDGVISSPFLAELQFVECCQCKENVTVANVVVETKAFTMQRNDLLNRISNYKKLLSEIEKEQALVEEKGKASTNSNKSIENFRSTLKELLLAARDNYRLDIPYDLYVEMAYGDNKRLGKLKNLSSKGACTEFNERGQLPRDKSDIVLQFLLPEDTEPVSLHASVVWSQKLTDDTKSQYVNLGVQFKDLKEETHACIWDFIVATELAPAP